MDIVSQSNPNVCAGCGRLVGDWFDIIFGRASFPRAGDGKATGGAEHPVDPVSNFPA